jgi:hypothetical protein
MVSFSDTPLLTCCLNFDFAILICLNPRLCSLMVRKWSTGPISLSYTTPLLTLLYTPMQLQEVPDSWFGFPVKHFSSGGSVVARTHATC